MEKQSIIIIDSKEKFIETFGQSDKNNIVPNNYLEEALDKEPEIWVTRVKE